MSITESISEELTTLMIQLTIDQRRYVVARMDYPTKDLAAKSIGLKVNTVYKWPALVERAVELMSMDIITGAKVMAERATAKAMAVKIKGLDSNDERVRQAVATEIIEWRLGKASQHHDVNANITNIVKGYTTDVNPAQWDEEPGKDGSAK